MRVEFSKEFEKAVRKLSGKMLDSVRQAVQEVTPLVWSMYADVSDYAELKDGTASTGLIFSSSSMAQKFGGAFGGAAVMWILAAFGYNTAEGAVQTEEALTGLNLLMSWIPAAVAVLAMIVVYFYPLTKKRVAEVDEKLKKIRAAQL